MNIEDIRDLYNLGNKAYNKKEFDIAQDFFGSAIDFLEESQYLDTENGQELHSLLLYNLGVTFIKQNKVTDAESLFIKTIKLYSNHSNIYDSRLSQCYFNLGYIYIYAKRKEINPGLAYIYFSRASMYNTDDAECIDAMKSLIQHANMANIFKV